MKANAAERRESILAALADVSALPASSARVVAILQDPDLETDDLVRAIEFDPSLTANVLRWANSAYFGGLQSIDSIQQAVVRLGHKRMNQLVLTAIATPIIGRGVGGYDLPPGDLLRHSVATAIGTQELAAVLEREPAAHAFTAGLLHDVGKIVLASFIELGSGALLEISRSEGIPFDEAERRHLGIDHAEVGAALLEVWGLPSPIVQVVRWHHHPEEWNDPSGALDFVHVAQFISMEAGLGLGIDGLNYRLSKAVAKRLALSPNAIEKAACRVLSTVKDIEALIGEPPSD